MRSGAFSDAADVESCPVANRDWATDPTSLTVPPYAGPNQPRIFFGPDIPPELLAWAAGLGYTIYAVEVWYYDATTYQWNALVNNGVGVTSKISGTYSTLGGVIEIGSIALVAGLPLIGHGSATASMIEFWQKTTINFQSGNTFNIDSGCAWNVDGKSAGRGNVFNYYNAGASGAIGVAETVAFNAGYGATYKSGRSFKGYVAGQIQQSAAANNFIIRVRLNNIAGTAICATRETTNAVTTIWKGFEFEFNVGGADVAATDMVVTLQSSAGTTTINGTATAALKLKVEDQGAASDFSTMPLTI